MLNWHFTLNACLQGVDDARRNNHYTYYDMTIAPPRKIGRSQEEVKQYLLAHHGATENQQLCDQRSKIDSETALKELWPVLTDIKLSRAQPLAHHSACLTSPILLCAYKDAGDTIQAYSS